MAKLKIAHLLTSDIVFVLLFCIFASFYYDSVLDKGVLNTHIWRQADCLSLARQYSRGANFFQPQMNALLADNLTSSKSAGEFPILYYIVGLIWKIFGESYLSYRLFYLLILFAGLFAFYKSLQILFNDNFWAIAIAALLFTSPVLVAYGTSFLTDGPAFSFILTGLYFFLRYALKNKRKSFFISMAFFAIAGLVKVSSLIAFFFLFFILTIESFSYKSLGNRKLFKCNAYEWLGFFAVIIIIFSWYLYAYYYNGVHGFKYTFNSIYPIWIMDKSAFESLFKNVQNFTSIVFFSRPVIFTFFFIGILNFFLLKKIPPFAYLANVITILGSIVYFLLWAALMDVHDYYYIAFLILFPGILIPFIWLLKTHFLQLFLGYPVKMILSIFLIYNFVYCLSVVKLKTLAQHRSYKIVGNQEFVEVMKWTNWDVGNNWKRFEAIKPYLKQIGIKQDDKIISLPDESFNVSLFLADHKGWTNFQHYDEAEDIEKLIEKGAKYLLISDRGLLGKDYLAPFLHHKIGDYKGIEIYKLAKK